MVAEKITQCMKPHGEEGFETIENMNENTGKFLNSHSNALT